MDQQTVERRADLVAATRAALESRGAAPEVSGLAASLLASSPYEDLQPYTPAELAILAAGASAFAATRTAGAQAVRVFEPADEETASGSALRGVTIVELVADDMPFLLDSALAELIGRDLEPRLVLQSELRFDGDAGHQDRGLRRRLIHIHVPRLDAGLRHEELADALREVLAEVHTAVSDWRPMRQQLARQVERYSDRPPSLPADEAREGEELLAWLVDGNFILLGTREYVFEDDAEGGRMRHAKGAPGAGLGLFRDPRVEVLRRHRELVGYTPETLDFLRGNQPLLVTKASVRSRVHRSVHLDCISVKLFDGGGVAGELRVVGLFTAAAYDRSVRSIPLLRRKVALVLERVRLDPDSHEGRALLHVLETFPRDELFQIDQELLSRWAPAIQRLQRRPRIRVLTRTDHFDRFVSVLVYIPRDRYDADVRNAVGAMLAEELDGFLSASYPSFTDEPLVRVHYIVGRYGGETPAIDAAELELRVAELSRTWSEALADALGAAHVAAGGGRPASLHADAFPAAYRGTYSASTAVRDLDLIERLTPVHPFALAFHRPEGERPERASLRLFHRGEPLALSERVPLLENMGFRVIDERSFPIVLPTDGTPGTAHLHDMLLEKKNREPFELRPLVPLLTDCFAAVVEGEAENDGYNALVLEAGLNWRDAAVLRAIGRYLRQVGIAYSQDYLWRTLARHRRVARLLIELFHARLRPDGRTAERRAEEESDLVAQIESELEAVPNLDEDRIVRRFTNVVQATLRTNNYQADEDGRPRPALAIKLDGRRLEALPRPRPFVEVFVYGPRVEGVHLRGGRVARGGLRWSDRPHDYRTEVLGLVKAQQVKNAVIVPVGAKGGFVPLRLPTGDREAVLREGTACYRIFVASLLDVTDNLDDGIVRAPESTFRHDGDDPYLVVAADKGTATFSDIANQISTGRRFWLGDAFASGGSAGYDHKKMGITARGAWEAVKRHFREIDVDVQATPFTVIGCGDMSGDVFGNGMLQSDKIRLLAAFDHRDIFLDPEPDPAAGFAERRRLYELPGSSWQDYSHELVSPGGGVFSRRAKTVPLSPEAQRLLELPRDRATPDEVIRSILRLPADLLWFGGIGTYVRSSDESDADVGDRANDPLRVSAHELRVKVVGEGANLGMTQRARIELARAGGRLNTDAIDNSGGVNCSDVEVNIKIALQAVVRTGELTLAERDTLLADMTDEVAALVLRNNHSQTLALSLAERRGSEEIPYVRRLMRRLEDGGMLDRDVEHLPDDVALGEREGRGEALTRPELAVLLAYAKIDLCNRLLVGSLPDDASFTNDLLDYFPAPIRQRLAAAVEAHPLRREIVATVLANAVIDRGGPTYVARLVDETGADVDTVVRAYVVAWDACSLAELAMAIDRLDGVLAGEEQLELYAAVQDAALAAGAWFLRNADLGGELATMAARYRERIGAALGALSAALSGDDAEAESERARRLASAGVPEAVVGQVTMLPWLTRAADIARVATETGRPPAEVAVAYATLDEHFGLARLRAAATALRGVDYYERLSVRQATDLLAEAQRRISRALVTSGESAQPALEAWRATRAPSLAGAERLFADIARGPIGPAHLSVAASRLLELAGT